MLPCQLESLEQETVKWCREILRNSPTAIRVLKSSLNAVDDGHAGLQVPLIIIHQTASFAITEHRIVYMELIGQYLQCRNLVEMPHSYSMALRKVTRGRQHICNDDVQISQSFPGDLNIKP